MTNNKIQSLVTVQAIKDFLLIKFTEEAEIKKKCVVAVIKEINSKKQEKLCLKQLDNSIFDGLFIPFIEDMDYGLDLEFEPVKSVFFGLAE